MPWAAWLGPSDRTSDGDQRNVRTRRPTNLNKGQFAMSRVTEIRYVGYATPDFEAERAFYVDQWGLEPVTSSDGMAYFKAKGAPEHHVVRLRKDPAKRVDVIALAAFGIDGHHDALTPKFLCQACD